MQKYVFFFNNKSIRFLNSLPVTHCENQKDDEGTFLESNNNQDLNFSEFFSEENNENWTVVCENKLKLVLRKFLSYVEVIKAAGGLVKNGESKFLFIYRNNTWDLPKGKAELFESVQETALREVQEECGIENLKLKRFICRTYHIYKYNNKFLLKKTYWFEMSSKNPNKLIPQREEGITDVQWLNIDEIKSVVYRNTYSNIKLVMDTALK